MKVTRIKTKHGKWGKPLAMTVEELAAAISSEKWQTEVERIALTRHRDRLPYVIFSGLFDRQGLHCLRQPTGLIDTVTPINYQQLYAQALYELEHGEPCFMTPGEEQLMQRHNEQFQNLSTADILLSTYYAPASRSQQNFIRAVDILADLQQHAKGSDRPNMSRLVKALKAAHYEYGARQGVRGWYARRL